MQSARWFGVLLVAATIVSTTPGLTAQAAQEPARQASHNAVSASGELLRVDSDAKTLAIKTADGTEMQFAYTDQTEVVGGEKDVAGLATKSGAQVTVSYTAEGSVNTATKIEIQSAK